MNRQIAPALGIALLCSGTARLGQSQTRPLPGSPVVSAPVVQAVAAPTGANLQAAGAGQGWLDLGHLMWAQPNPTYGLARKKDPGSFSVSTGFGLLLDCPPSDHGRSGIVKASLQQSDIRYSVFLDGVKMTASPAIVGAAVLCGSTTQHSFELQVPVQAQAGPIYPNLLFQVALR